MDEETRSERLSDLIQVTQPEHRAGLVVICVVWLRGSHSARLLLFRDKNNLGFKSATSGLKEKQR